jgi:hypothetical protein
MTGMTDERGDATGAAGADRDLGEVDELAGKSEHALGVLQRQPEVGHHGESGAARLAAARGRQLYERERLLANPRKSYVSQGMT